MLQTRNKLKRRKTCKDATDLFNERHVHAETEACEKGSGTSGSTLLSEYTKCTSSTNGVITREHHPQYEKNCMPNIKLAPIFLRTTMLQNTSVKQTGKGRLKHPLDRGPLLHRSSGTTAQTRHHEVKEEQPTSSSSLMIERKGRCKLSASAQNSCLEEITQDNPSFPLRRVFLALKTKHRDSLRDISQETVPTSSQVPCDHIGEKRKQPYESDASDNSLINRRCPSIVSKEDSATGHCPSAPEYNDPGGVQPRRGRLSRTYRLKQHERRCQDVKYEPKPNLTSQTESASVVFEAGACLQRHSIIADMLWTGRYSPQHSNEVIENTSSVNKLHSWLKKWKLRADGDESKNELEMKREESSNESWDCGDFQGEAGLEEKHEQLCTAMLITGPPGIGKTSSVYACAQELGFKVFEVNSSSQRSGHNVLSQLKEAVQSHLVETSGKDALKPAYLNIYNTNVSTTKHDTLTGNNMLSAKHVISTSKRRGQKSVKSHSKRKPSPASIILANFFKIKAKADQLHSSVLSEKPAIDISSVPGNELRNCSTVMERKKMATSLILFEEVDVIFDDDIGFLTAVKTFMRNTKRPVILTASDPLFRERFDGHFEVTIFKTPSLVLRSSASVPTIGTPNSPYLTADPKQQVNVCSYLRLVCLAESVRTELGDVTNLLRLCKGDIRSCLLQLQFWVHSGGQLAPQREYLQKDPTRTLLSNISEVEDISDNPHLPHCDVGCTPSMLGFQTETRLSLLTLLKTNLDLNKLLNILAESWRRGVPLLYSNMDLLLPLTTTAQGSSTCADDVPLTTTAQGSSTCADDVPLTTTAQGSSTCADDVTCSGLQSDQTAPARQPQKQQLVEVIDLTGATSVNSVRNFSRLGRRKCMPTVFDDRSSSGVAAKTHITSVSLMGTQYRATCSNDKPKTEDSVTKLATLCLDALIDFIDHMSYLDSTVPTEESHVFGPCRSAEFVWTGAEIRDGLLDEMRKGDSCEQGERILEIQASVEGLAFRTCWRKVSEVWTKVQGYRQGLGDREWQRLVERFTIPVSFHRQSFNFSSTLFCDPSAAQKRYELSKKVLRSRFLSVLGNRRAITVEYMPMLRSICRSDRAEQQGQPPARFYYLSDIGLGLSKSTIQLLSEEFP